MIKIELRQNAGGVDFLQHSRYRVKIDKKVVALAADPIEVLDLIQAHMEQMKFNC